VFRDKRLFSEFTKKGFFSSEKFNATALNRLGVVNLNKDWFNSFEGDSEVGYFVDWYRCKVRHVSVTSKVS